VAKGAVCVDKDYPAGPEVQ